LEILKGFRNLKPFNSIRGVPRMRIDKYLKVSRLIKRRTLASEACSQGKIKINEKLAKPGSEVKVGDILEIQLGTNIIKVKVMSISETVSKEASKEMYSVLN
jgi:ribosomal 50S subunit-recycling heat shock protein